MSVPTDILRSLIEHVFMPPKLPQEHPGEETERKMNVTLCNSLKNAAQEFLQNVPLSEGASWMHMIKMMELAHRAANSPFETVDLARALSDMASGDVFCIHIRAQNAALIVRRPALANFVQFEVFEVSPLASTLMKTEGKLLCSYPGPAIQIPEDTFMEECFLRELSSFLVQMDVDRLDRNTFDDSAHPGHISGLLVGILGGFGQPAVVDRFTKRIGDEALLDRESKCKPWRRSPLWLILRVTLQSSLRSSNLYKPFILFFHAHLLRSCVRRNFPSELLYVMRVKTARRLSKLGPAISHLVYEFVNDTAKETEDILSKRWTTFQAIGSTNPTSQLKGLDFIADSRISLDNSYKYLTKMLPSASDSQSRRQFTPSHGSRLKDVHDFTQFTDDLFTKAITNNGRIAIADFELSVEKNLESWIAASTDNNHALRVISSCIRQYFSGATRLYGGNAEDNSMMTLTIMDLWVALDRIAVKQCPLLKRYSPEIPSDFLHCLLLHHSSALTRALHIEEYLHWRHKEVVEVTSIFSNSVDDSCFAVKYFRTSKDHQRIYNEINTHAQQERATKRAELASLNQKSKTLLNEASRMGHEQSRDSFGRESHSPTCRKCQLKKEVGGLSVRVHEWPLPSSTNLAQRMVFELSPPHAFSAWRDITYLILRGICLPSTPNPRSRPQKKVLLDSFSGLRQWAVRNWQDHGVTIASDTSSSYVVVTIPAEEHKVLVDNRLSFRLFDRSRQSWAIVSSSGYSTSRVCSPLIPKSSPYHRLHHFVSGTQHTPNDIIAAQADCPNEIRLHEFLSFSGMRSGPRLQWLNIARELASSALPFSREEVHTLITQVAWQLGPLSNGVREWHIDLTLSSFGNVLLRELEYLLERIKANWQEEVTVRTITLICSRLLASATDPDICRRACALLREARNVTYRWIGEVSMRLDLTEDETSRAGLQRRLCMVAATCFSSFDVCPEHIPAALATEEDFSIAMQSAVIVYDNTSPSLLDQVIPSELSLSDGEKLPPAIDLDVNALYLIRLLSRHRRLLRSLEPIFSQCLPSVLGGARLLHASTYDHALAQLRPGYHRHDSSRWHTLPELKSRWVSKRKKEVHHDLLTGELLIGGKRIQKLPREVVEHPIYASIFGTKSLDVAPADISGMDYVTRSTVSGFQILFAWNKGRLILQARRPGDPQILQLIPRSILLGDFPRHLVDEHHHWLDLSSGELEFRPARSPWASEPSNWRICIRSPGILRKKSPARAVLRKNCQGISPIQLIDIRSTTFSVVSRLLSPLESPERIIVTHTAQTLEVSLPRLNLSFFINTNWELECRSMPGYVIDNNQSCGTMFGLRNKLVLCHSPSNSEEPLLPRRVIIPQGEITFRTDGNFTSTYINTDTGEHFPVRWHEYTIDADLRCLASNTSLSSKLYQCYLHALTSHCLPDPLLGHTGTEEALYILRSAACRSFKRLDLHEAKLLKLIRGLSPIRDYNDPAANVKWNDLPTLSQHHDFFLIVRSLLDHARALEALYDQPVDFMTDNCNQTLLNRAAFRNESYYPLDLQTSKRSSDSKYRSRDVSDLENAEDMAAFQTSWSIWNARPSSPLESDHSLLELWDRLKSRKSLGPASSGVSLRYSKAWLVNVSNDTLDWSVIFNLHRKSVKQNRRNLRIELCFTLSAAAYGQSKLSNILSLVILALEERYCNLSPPLESFYALSDGLVPELTRLEDLISKSALPLSSIPAHSLTTEVTNARSLELWPDEIYDAAIRRESLLVAESILHQWPDQSVYFRKEWFHMSDCKRRIEEYMESILHNIQLREYVLLLQDILRDHYGHVLIPAANPFTVSPQFSVNQSKAPSYSLHNILLARANTPALYTDGVPFPGGAIPPATAPEGDQKRVRSDSLETLIEELRTSQQSLLQLYGNDLDKSYRELSGQDASQIARGAIPSDELLLLYHKECSRRKDKIFSQISVTLSPSQSVEKTHHIAGLWPRITPRSILRQLAQDRISTLPDQWKFLIMRYAVSFVNYQQSLRMLELSSRQKYDEILQEIEAVRENVLAESTPDWLLVQIETNLLARPNQVAVAHEMISPSSKRNISLQFNMGEGKSSVIIPLAASTLANGSSLVRVMTLKPLSNQTFQLLTSRLSGLANRPIFYLPISRSLRMNSSLVRTIKGLYERCIAEGGVLVAQAEHILSLKLMHIDILLTARRRDDSLLIPGELEELHDWLDEVSRDILDEGDEILRVQYQLIYSAGEPMLVDDHPNRWTTIQQVLSRLQLHAVKLCASFPKMLAVDTRPNGFPVIRILDSTMSQQISSFIIDDALEGQLYNLPLDTLPPPIHAAARRFMTQMEVSDVDHDLIRMHCAGTRLFSGILLLRGLLMDTEGILAYVLKERRWRVDYGLDPRRTPLAVPYRAKDVPSLRAEFAHPDVAISLTCLSYYYDGLTKDQVLLCFDLLAKLNNPEMEYDHWVELGQDLPAELRRLNGVNTEDETQMDKFLVPLFSRNKGVVDFYLSQVVFPRAAREFPSKLPTSAWDLVEDKTNVTTGFSGTNDNRYLLPTSITQEDPKFVLRTNALVLQHLLRPENDHYECTGGENGERESATAFLKRLVSRDPEIRVLLDVGAQMLELKNEELARHWLLLRPDVSAAIFFNDSDHLMAVTPDGTIEPFISSPFNRQLERCVVYLDDAHTRGTDLKLPQGFRAAVTLGPNVTKDRLMQGCMRMRQLGKGHSVTFFAPGEIDSRIRSLIPNGMASWGRIRVLDIVRWAIHETCEDIRHNLPCWAQQGLDHHKRFMAYKQYQSTRNLEFLRRSWLQSESRTLEEVYWVKSGTKISPEIKSITSISERLKRLGATELVDVRLAEEQEREVSQEVDTVGDMRLLPRVRPAQHIITGDIRKFIETGKLPVFSPQIIPLLAPISMAGALDSSTEWSPSPLATADFTTTNLDSGDVALTEFLRPVNWILSSGTGKDSIVIVISPHEANELLPMIRKSSKVRLHIYAPRIQSSMRSFSDLTFYSIPDSQAEPWSAPPHVRTELNLFAGQLYFDSRGEYDRVCVLLALSMAHRGAEHKDIDGFVPPAYRTGGSSPFETSRIPILKTLIGLRQKGMGYHRTHLGQILNGKPLSEETLNSLISRYIRIGV